MSKRPSSICYHRKVPCAGKRRVAVCLAQIHVVPTREPGRQQTQFRQRLRLATEDRDNTTAPLYCASKTSRHTHTLSKNVHCWTLSMHHQKFVSRKVACPLDARFSTLRALSGTAAPAACWCFLLPSSTRALCLRAA